MFFDDEEHGRLNYPQLIQISTREFGALGPHLEESYAVRSLGVPTHTEDGIPIRKVYVSNFPPKTTRAEIFGVFAQYGFIKSCWMRMGGKGPNRNPTPTYAFITYGNPEDAHKALMAPYHEKILRGRMLKTSPADSWHQPAQDNEGRIGCKPHSQHRVNHYPPDIDPEEMVSLDQGDVPTEASEPETDMDNELESQPETETLNILDILNMDCLTQILSYVSITELIRSERVSKRWQGVVQEYLLGIRLFKTSWWPDSPATLTTAILRRVLQRAGGSLLRLHIDHNWSALNDRTAHTLGKFCPKLQELKVVGMQTRNWNPLIYGCKQLRIVSFVSCNKLADSSLVQLLKADSCIESLTIANNTHVTGLFLSGAKPPRLQSLAFYNCYSLQPAVLCAALHTLKNITTLKLDVCPVSLWKVVPQLLKKVKKLKELSLSEFLSVDIFSTENDEFCSSLSKLTELKVLNLFRNVYITNAVLKQIAQSCHKLESLNISSCNARNTYPGVGDIGILAICTSCRMLRHLDVSYLAALTDAGLRHVSNLAHLDKLVARGNPALSSAPFAAALTTCHNLQEVDVCGCDSVSEEVAYAAVQALKLHPRCLLLRLAGTLAVHAEEMPTHKLLTVNIYEDLSNMHLRPDFVDDTFEDSSENSFDDIYEFEDFAEFFETDEEDDDPGVGGFYAYGMLFP